MTNRSKFEQMLEHLINEDQEKAQEIFHQLVVEKSRSIYEGILAEDFGMEDDEMGSQGRFGGIEGEDDADIGGDETDDFISDVETDDDSEEYGDEESGEELEDRVVDLEDALDELRAEFEELMSQESGEEDHEGSDFDFGSDEGEEDEGGEDDQFGFDSGEEDEEDLKDNYMREYIEKVTLPKHGDNGQNNKSIVAKKNDMGGKAVKFDQGGDSTTGGTKGGLLNPSSKEENFKNINVPGGNAGKSAFSNKVANGHGAETKGKNTGADNNKSILGSRK